MTVKHQLTKYYRKGFEIAITSDSFNSFKKGERDTLDHIVEYNNQFQEVRCKPRVQNYQNYILVESHYPYNPVLENSFQTAPNE